MNQASTISSRSNELPALHIAVAYNDEALVLLYVSSRKHDLNAKETLFGRTALHIAVSNDNVKMARLLLVHGSNVNEVSKDKLTALHIAVSNRSKSMVELLLEYGVEVNPLDNFHGKTPLYMAVEYGCPDIVRLLLQNGASVENATLRNSTLLHVAVRIGHVEMTQLIIGYVAIDEFHTKDNVQGKTPLDLARDLNYNQIAEMLDVQMMGGRRKRDHFDGSHGKSGKTVHLLLRSGKRIPVPGLIIDSTNKLRNYRQCKIRR